MLEGIYQRSHSDPPRGRAAGMGEMVVKIMHEAEEAIRA